ncbi:hypothetical protein [Altererythrobacter sp. Root672]|uniref:hypothetical protein n=1 Tax=Altererythrobacter sp. Root672 TaxID=1736584 RepID=UPI0006F3C9B4|nr:hypothetical protein [Altererythrobacter sp. Root672]KRA82548.1 hypothetical protein ASD76_00065 [Altererythrobacter sp. Root672]
MNTNNYLQANVREIGHYHERFGESILERMEAINADVEAAGIPGLLSLIEALIGGNIRDREDILDHLSPLCRPFVYEAAEKLLDKFEGNDPWCHLWTANEGGYYSLTEGN